jgi:hypothetical protein
MRQILRCCLALLLIADLAGAGTLPINSPMGMVAEAMGCNFTSGTTLFLNSDIWTTPKGSATLLLTRPSGTLLLLGASRVRILSSADLPVADLLEGTLRFSLREPLRLKALHSNISIRPRKSGVVSGQIRIVGKNRIVVDAVDAPIPVEVDGQIVEVPLGFAYTLDLATPEPGGPGPKGAGAAAALTAKKVTIIAITMVAVTIGVGVALAETQRRTFASPFIP